MKRRETAARTLQRCREGAASDAAQGRGVLRVVRLVLGAGFGERAGGGEVALSMRVSSFLVGWVGLMVRLVREDAVSTRTLRTMVRFACHPARVMSYNVVTPVAFGATGFRCSRWNRSCPFRSSGRCQASTLAASLDKRTLRRIVADCVGSARYNAAPMLDDASFAQRAVEQVLAPQRARFDANDALLRQRGLVGMPEPSEWRGALFRVDAVNRWLPSRVFTQYCVVDARASRRRRVTDALLVRRADAPSARTFWVGLRAHRDGWAMRFPDSMPVPMRISPVPLMRLRGGGHRVAVPRFPDLVIRYSPAPYRHRTGA